MKERQTKQIKVNIQKEAAEGFIGPFLIAYFTVAFSRKVLR